MKKLMVSMAMLALVLRAFPAVAQVGNGVGQESESEEVAIEGSVTNSGDYA